ncbi:MAG: hypothetical protein JSV52_08390 [Candidatus Zixiibacteriota bacterium]|nr:MAG: hypothetical protein JSV52_08390 [candidate division Zixibacteria bacterium]
MARRKTRTSRKAVRRSRKACRPWSREEIAFMRKWYRRYETAWVARQLGRSVYSVRYKAVDLNIRKAKPSIWKGQKGPVNAFRKTSWRKPTSRKTASRRRTSRSRSWRATSRRRTTRRARPRRKARRRSR